MKHLPNTLTALRIVGSIGLLFCNVPGWQFWTLYVFCGLTDMIDGTVARKTGADSKFGARLDTFADFVFVLVCSIKILPTIHIPVWLWVWISIIALIKMFNFALVFVRKKELLSTHSTLNKVTGFALFILPLSLTFIEPLYSVTAICILATIAAMQEVYFVSKTDKTTY